MIPAPTKLKVNDFILTVEFEDGQTRQIDILTFLGNGKKADELKKSKGLVKTAQIEDGMSITWKNGFSLDPDVVYEEGTAIKALPATGNLNKIKRALAKIIKIQKRSS